MAGARFVATNADALLPVEGGQVVPGAGTMIAAIQTATAVEPIVLGKPEPGLFEVGVHRLGVCRRSRWRWSATVWIRTSSAATAPGCARSWC